MTGADPLELLAIATRIAREAGELAERMRKAGVAVQATKSNALDIVTQADTAVESLIRARLKEVRPDDGFLGEESGEEPGAIGITWVVDPIDGTVNYLYGSPNYAVSIAATILDSEGFRVSLAGCVFSPELSAEYTAAVGHPALLNGRPLRVNQGVPLDRALVSTGIPYDLQQRKEVLDTFGELAPRVRDLRLVGAASLDICGVAEGRTDAHFQRNLPVWDYAAASLIASQAGAVVWGVDRRPPGGNLLLVADAPLAQSLAPLLTKELR